MLLTCAVCTGLQGLIYVYFLISIFGSDFVAGVMHQLHEESSGRTAYQPCVRILKRDRTAAMTHSTNQSVCVLIISLFIFGRNLQQSVLLLL